MVSDELTKKELELEREMKVNYINNMAALVASNINSFYKCYRNDIDISFNTILNTSQDIHNLSSEEEKIIFDLTNKTLEKEYGLSIVNDNKNKKIVLCSKLSSK